MNCADSHEKLVLALYGELPDEQCHALALHLKGCAECQDEHDQLQALRTLATARPVVEPDANLLARSRTRLEDALDAIPPKQWYDRVGEWMTRTAAGLQAAPAAACLLLVAGAGLGTMGGYWFAERHAVTLATAVERTQEVRAADAAQPAAVRAGAVAAKNADLNGAPFAAGEVAGISGVARNPKSNMIEVSYNRVEPTQIKGTLDDPQIRQLLMLASENGASPAVRDDSVELLATECRSGKGCLGTGTQGAGIKDALMVALRYDRSAQVRQKALGGLQPFIADDLRVRDAVLEALMNDPDAHIRSAAIGMLPPVEADTSVRQALSTVALSDRNSNIRNASRVVLRRVSEIQ